MKMIFQKKRFAIPLNQSIANAPSSEIQSEFQQIKTFKKFDQQSQSV